MSHGLTDGLAGSEHSRVQRWLTVGLTAWQDCLIRQQAALWLHNGSDSRRSAPETHLLSVGGLPTSMAPHRTELVLQFESIDRVDSLCGRDVDVLVATRDVWGTVLQKDALIDDLKESDTLRLLWDWTPAGSIALTWALLQGLHGVVRDAETLRSWVTVAVNRAGNVLAPPHPLIAHLKLPDLGQSLRFDPILQAICQPSSQPNSPSWDGI